MMTVEELTYDKQLNEDSFFKFGMQTMRPGDRQLLIKRDNEPLVLIYYYDVLRPYSQGCPDERPNDNWAYAVYLFRGVGKILSRMQKFKDRTSYSYEAKDAAHRLTRANADGGYDFCQECVGGTSTFCKEFIASRKGKLTKNTGLARIVLDNLGKWRYRSDEIEKTIQV